MIRTIAILSYLFLTSALTVAAQQPAKVDIHGIVVDRSSGAPIRAAAVKVVGQKWAAITDQDGRFRLQGVTPGSVRVEAEQLGYAKWSQPHEAADSAPLLRIELEPDPIMLKGIQVTSDRMRARRNSVATSVRAYTAEQLGMSPAFDALEFLRSRTMFAPCPARLWWVSQCVMRRGAAIAPSVTVDEAPFMGGLDVLAGWPIDDLYLIEVYGSGTHIRVYTKRFARLLAMGRVRLSPVLY
jgi:hypothetical protein